jgi:hypothetical protein
MEYRLVTPKNVIHLSVGEAASDFASLLVRGRMESVEFVIEEQGLCLAKMLLGFRIKDLRSDRMASSSGISDEYLPSFGSVSRRFSACSVPAVLWCLRISPCDNNLWCSSVGIQVRGSASSTKCSG